MNKLSVNLNNCFGIKSLTHEFNFNQGNVFSIYARNGLMKTSFAKTFQKIQQGKDSDICDAIFGLKGSAEVLIDGIPIHKDQIFTIRSFESAYESDITSLLVDEPIREKLKEVFKARSTFLKKLEQSSGLKIKKISGGKDIFELEPTIVNDFEFDENSILLNLESLKAYTPEIICDDVQYLTIFDTSVLKKIQSPDFQDGIKNFLEASGKIYDSFEYLERGRFTYPKLKDLKKSLDKNAFFVKKNRIVLAGTLEIPDLNAYESRIQEVETEIKKSREYQNIENLLSDVGGRLLKDVIETHPELIEYLSLEKLPTLRKSLWGSYIKKYESIFDDLLAKYKALSTSVDSISLEDTQWKRALGIFEDRFFVPFKMSIANLKGAVIGENIPQVEFTFEDGTNTKTINRNTLEDLDVLSQGEKRALYLLNIIFDLEKIKATGKECVLIIDDIADSFDYKNKYAIIEYLYELANEEKIFMLIFTHNYDFHRTLTRRLGINQKNRLIVGLSETSLTLNQEPYKTLPFDDWKKCKYKEDILALIPFVRNLIDYSYDRNISNKESDSHFLTSLLHQKTDSPSIAFKDIEPIYKEYVGVNQFFADIKPDDLVLNTLFETCENIKNTDPQLKNKIILAMGIRLKAEKFMISQITGYKGQFTFKNNNYSNTDYLELIGKERNQTRKLFNGYSIFGDNEKKKILDKVNIMTPEHIHINSFMYEPLIDMDILELLHLYQAVKSL